MFRMLSLGVLFSGLLLIVTPAQAQTKTKAKTTVLPSITGAGVTPGYVVDTYKHKHHHHHGIPPYYYYPPVVPVVYPVAPVLYPPAPVIVYTVYYRVSAYHPWTAYSGYASYSLAYSVADGLAAQGYQVTVY